MSDRIRLDAEPASIRSAPLFFAEAGGVLSEDGKTIRGLSIMKPRCEARGHGYWIDEVTCAQVLADCKRFGKDGVPSNLGHGAFSDDGSHGIQNHVGSFTNFNDEDGVPRGDLSLSGLNPEVERKVKYFASERPRRAGLSIVASRKDYDAMRAFMDAHRNEKGAFESPDELNTKNLPHLRIVKGTLESIDVVDRPAANPEGMFGELGDSLFEARSVVLYLLGLADEEPTEMAGLSINPSRVRGFFQRILEDEQVEFRRLSAADQEDLNMADENKNKGKDNASKDAPPAGGDTRLSEGAVSLDDFRKLQEQVTQLATQNEQLKEQNISTAARLIEQTRLGRRSAAMAFVTEKLGNLPAGREEGLTLEQKADMVVALDVLPDEQRAIVLGVLEACSIELGRSDTRRAQGPTGERVEKTGDVFADIDAAVLKIRKRAGNEQLSERDATQIAFREDSELYARYVGQSTVGTK